jgi:hypothetical protein
MNKLLSEMKLSQYEAVAGSGNIWGDVEGLRYESEEMWGILRRLHAKMDVFVKNINLFFFFCSSLFFI